MSANLDHQATQELEQASIDIVSAKKTGFRDGFIGHNVRMPSLGYDQQTSYLTGYQEGKKHREQVDELCQEKGMSVDELMYTAFQFYYEKEKDKNNSHL